MVFFVGSSPNNNGNPAMLLPFDTCAHVGLSPSTLHLSYVAQSRLTTSVHSLLLHIFCILPRGHKPKCQSVTTRVRFCPIQNVSQQHAKQQEFAKLYNIATSTLTTPQHQNNTISIPFFKPTRHLCDTPRDTFATRARRSRNTL